MESLRHIYIWMYPLGFDLVSSFNRRHHSPFLAVLLAQKLAPAAYEHGPGILGAELIDEICLAA